MQTRQSSVRQSVSQTGREARGQAVSQYDSLSVNHALNQCVIHLFHMPFHQAIKLQHVTCQLHISRQPRQCQLDARVNMFTQPRPCPNSCLNRPCKPQQQPPKLTKCQQSRHCGSMELMLFVISAQMSYPIHRHSHSLYLLVPLPPLSSSLH